MKKIGQKEQTTTTNQTLDKTDLLILKLLQEKHKTDRQRIIIVGFIFMSE